MTDGPGLLRNIAMITLATGAGLWTAIIFAPAPSGLPPTLQVNAPTSQETQAVARWFGGGSVRVRVAVSGIIAGPDGTGAALLSVNGSPAQAYRTGQILAPGVTLKAVGHDAVSVDQDGIAERVEAPRRPGHVVEGFIPVARPASQP